MGGAGLAGPPHFRTSRFAARRAAVLGTPLCSRRPRPEGAGRPGGFFRGLGPRPKGERSEAFDAEGGAQAMLTLGGTARLALR